MDLISVVFISVEFIVVEFIIVNFITLMVDLVDLKGDNELNHNEIHMTPPSEASGWK